MASRRKSRAKIAARRLPSRMADVAFSKWSAKKERRQRERGTFGPASPVRHIKPERNSASVSPHRRGGVMGWQPIESAPKDGTAVLIWSPDATGHGVSLAVWSEFDGDPDGGAWFDEWSDSCWPIDADPTHWMPLPPPPEAA